MTDFHQKDSLIEERTLSIRFQRGFFFAIDFILSQCSVDLLGGFRPSLQQERYFTFISYPQNADSLNLNVSNSV
jgi:hypothetical protein